MIFTEDKIPSKSSQIKLFFAENTFFDFKDRSQPGIRLSSSYCTIYKQSSMDVHIKISNNNNHLYLSSNQKNTGFYVEMCD
jgi:hypothetical protein